MNGKYNLFTLWYRGVLGVKITEEQIIINASGINLWAVTRPNISTIKIQPEILGAKVIVTPNDGKGFLFLVDNTSSLLNSLKAFNYPIQYNENALKAEAKRYKFTTNPVVLTVGVILGVAFIVLLVYGIILGSRELRELR